MPEEYILIKFVKPTKEEYSSKDDCAPKKRGDGCYGDCMDCLHRDEERYERLSKFGKKAVYYK